MAKLTWDEVGERLFETGVSKGVLYVYDTTQNAYGAGEAWNGLTGVTESPSGAEETALWANNSKYLSMYSAEELGLTIEAYTYPDSWAQCDGSAEIANGVVLSQQARKMFGLTYQTVIGNDTEDTAHGYKIHIVYGAKCSPSERAYATINDSPEAITMSWSVSTTPVNVAGYKPTALITIDSTKADVTKLESLKDLLYGTDNADATLPTPAQILTLFG